MVREIWAGGRRTEIRLGSVILSTDLQPRSDGRKRPRLLRPSYYSHLYKVIEVYLRQYSGARDIRGTGVISGVYSNLPFDASRK